VRRVCGAGRGGGGVSQGRGKGTRQVTQHVTRRCVTRERT
jgi:hypothetical protein